MRNIMLPIGTRNSELGHSMRTLAIAVIVVIAIAALFWSRAGSRLRPESLFVVRFDAEAITVLAPTGETQSVKWKDLTKVGIRTTDDGPSEPDVFWGLYTGGDKAALVFPGGSTGEQEILAEMQSRLPGFDDSQVVKAMGSTWNAYFVVWGQSKDVRETVKADPHERAVPTER